MDALFGGSFDPVHLGHLIVAEAVADALGGRVRFLPAREQPFKGAAHVATPEQRAEMLALAVAGNPRFGVERIELGLPVPSYTVRTLRALAEREGAGGKGGGGGTGLRYCWGRTRRRISRCGMKWSPCRGSPTWSSSLGRARPSRPIG